MQEIEFDEMFTMAYRFVTETSEHIFLTGKAGTGKTTLLKYIREHCTKRIVVAAPTGVAAINAGGVTLHSLFQLPFHPFLPTRQAAQELLGKLRLPRNKQEILRKMELLVIDEVSMVRADVLDAIDAILKSVRRNHDEPFGGVQLLFIGDLHQLPPVAQHQEWSLLKEHYSSPFFFDSLVIKSQMPLLIELTKIHRQKEQSFVKLLNKVRNNEMEQDDYDVLHERYLPGFNPELDEKYITLTSHNKQADEINQNELHKIIDASYSFQAEIEGEFNDNALPADKTLVLKRGAQVMFLKNDGPEKRYYNGKIGTVVSVDDETIIVDCDGFEINVNKETWENTRYTVDKESGKLEEEVLGTFTQYALRLAWAITIHKSQGLTFDKVMIDAGAAFSSGQVYVALSRCTSLQGIVLLSKIPVTAIMSNQLVVDGQEQLAHKGSLEDRFSGARLLFAQNILEELFLFKKVFIAFNDLNVAIQNHFHQLNDIAFEWLKREETAFLKIRQTGNSFLHKIFMQLKEVNQIEENEWLQQRMKDAVAWFEPAIRKSFDDIVAHPLITEYREASGEIDPALNDLLVALHESLFHLQHCNNGFQLTGYLKNKLQYSLPKIKVSSYAAGKAPSAGVTDGDELLETLFRWRATIVEETNIPIYLIGSRSDLKNISTYRPFTKADLLRLPGFGDAKVKKYGDEILDIVKDHCDRYGLASNMIDFVAGNKKSNKEKKEKVDKIASIDLTLAAYKEGKNIKEIAAERNMAFSTIDGHLTKLVENGSLSIDDVMTGEEALMIRKALEDFNDELGVVGIYEKLEKKVTYNQIRIIQKEIMKEKGVVG